MTRKVQISVTYPRADSYTGHKVFTWHMPEMVLGDDREVYHARLRERARNFIICSLPTFPNCRPVEGLIDVTIIQFDKIYFQFSFYYGDR